MREISNMEAKNTYKPIEKNLRVKNQMTITTAFEPFFVGIESEDQKQKAFFGFGPNFFGDFYAWNGLKLFFLAKIN